MTSLTVTKFELVEIGASPAVLEPPNVPSSSSKAAVVVPLAPEDGVAAVPGGGGRLVGRERRLHLGDRTGAELVAASPLWL
jgi:hypothetical protein